MYCIWFGFSYNFREVLVFSVSFAIKMSVYFVKKASWRLEAWAEFWVFCVYVLFCFACFPDFFLLQHFLFSSLPVDCFKVSLTPLCIKKIWTTWRRLKMYKILTWLWTFKIAMFSFTTAQSEVWRSEVCFLRLVRVVPCCNFYLA